MHLARRIEGQPAIYAAALVNDHNVRSPLDPPSGMSRFDNNG
jgi:hypothetical protein